MLDFQGLDPLAHIANNNEEADEGENERDVFAHVPGPSKKRKRMTKQEQRKVLLRVKGKFKKQKDVENAI